MRDPVCGMTVGPDAATVEGYPEVGFCSEHCRREFTANPERYLGVIDDHHAVTEMVAVSRRPTIATPAVDSIHLSIQGMTCASCVSTVESALNSVPGSSTLESISHRRKRPWMSPTVRRS